MRYQNTHKVYKTQNIPWAKSWRHAVFVKDEPNADLVLVKEQKSKKCLYIDNGPARGEDLRWIGIKGSGQGQAISAFPYACGVCNVFAKY
jgi:hypothetical protein